MEPQGLDQAATQERENQLRFILNVGMQHWVMIAVFVAVGCLVGGALGYFFRGAPDVVYRYRSQAQLRVEQSPYEKETFQSLGNKPLFSNSPDALVDRINKRDVAEDVARALVQEALVSGEDMGALATEEDYHLKASLIESDLKFTPNQEARIIVIEGAGQTEAEARQIVEFAARAFIKRHRQYLFREKQETYEFFQSEIESVTQRLEAAESAEWEFQKEMGFRTYDKFQTDFERMRVDLEETEVKREEVAAKIAEIEVELRENNQALPSALSQINDEVVNKLLEDLNDLLQQQFTMSVQYTSEFPPLQRLREDIAEKQEAVVAAIQKLDNGLASGESVWDRRQSLRSQYVDLQLQATTLDIKMATTEKLYSEMIEEWPEISDKRGDYMNLSRAVEHLRKQFNRLLEKKAELEETMRRGTGPVEMHAAASPPTRIGLGRQIRVWINFLLGAIVGLIVGGGAAMMIEMLDTSIRTIEDVTQQLSLEVIGTIPRMQFGQKSATRRHAKGTYVAINDETKLDARIVTFNDRKSPISEAYRTLRTKFQLSTIQVQPRTIMVTSSVPAEGKTTTAANMAVTFADSGMKVLLVDTDLRRPQVHRMVKVPRSPGLSDALREGSNFQQCVRPTPVKNLYILPAGRVPPNPSELIGSSRMRNLMDQMSKQFDVVVCDAPSVLVVTDAVLLARSVDSVVLVVAASRASRETIGRAKRFLETAQDNIAGVVLNAVDASRRNYYYYYYYYDEGAMPSRGRWTHF